MTDRRRDAWLEDVDDLIAETQLERRNLDALLLSDPTPLTTNESETTDA